MPSQSLFAELEQVADTINRGSVGSWQPKPSWFTLGEPSCLPIVVDLAVRNSDRGALATGTTKLRHWSIEPATPLADRDPLARLQRSGSNEPVVRGMSNAPARLSLPWPEIRPLPQMRRFEHDHAASGR